MEKQKLEFVIAEARTDRDFEDCARVKNGLTPEEPVSAAELKSDAGNPENLLLVARCREEVAASGVCKPSSSPNQAFTMIRVLPEWRRKGLGTQLYEALSRHARKLGRTSLQGRVVETDAEALDYFFKRGFVEAAWECKVVLDVTAVPEQEVPLPEGVEIHSLAARPDLVDGAYEVAAKAIPDIPMPEPLVAPTKQSWLASEIHAASVRLDGSFVAVADGRVIGYAGIAQTGDASAENLLTAVARDWRGRGVAGALKRTQIQWAKKAGFEHVVTYNAKNNESMRKVNANLGYQPEPALMVLRGPLFGE